MYFFVHIKMSYYWFNREDLTDLYKTKMTDIIAVVVKKKLQNIILKTQGLKNANGKYRALAEEEKEAKREYQRNRYRSIKEKASQMSIKLLKY